MWHIKGKAGCLFDEGKSVALMGSWAPPGHLVGHFWMQELDQKDFLLSYSKAHLMFESTLSKFKCNILSVFIQSC